MDTATAPDSEPRAGWRVCPHPSWSWLLIVGLLSRILVVAWGDWCAHSRIPESLLANDQTVAAANLNYNARHMAALAVGTRRWVQPWYRWDAIWYAEVSQAGYDYDPDRQSSTAFLPLLPVIMAAGASVGQDRYWVGLLAVNLAFAVGLACFGRVVLKVTGDSGTAWRACLLLTAYPFALFFSAPYQESLGFALTAAALLAWSSRRPINAAAGLALASLARLTTAAMCLGLVAEWLDDKAHRRPARNSAWLVALSGGLGFALFCAYLGLRLGDPFVHLRAHASWGRQPASARNVALVLGEIVQQACSSPAHALVSLAIVVWTCQAPVRAGLMALSAWVLGQPPNLRPDPHPKARRSRARPDPREKGRSPEPAPTAHKSPAMTTAPSDRTGNRIAAAIALAALSLVIPGNPLRQVAADLNNWTKGIAILTFLGLGIHGWWRRGPLWGCMILLPILQGLATGTSLSIHRVVLAAFPAFVDLAELLRPRVAFGTWMIASVLAEAKLIDLFVNWAFLG